MQVNIDLNNFAVQVTTDNNQVFTFTQESLSLPPATLLQLKYIFALAKAEIDRVIAVQDYKIKQKKEEIKETLIASGVTKTEAKEKVYLDKELESLTSVRAEWQRWSDSLYVVISTIDHILFANRVSLAEQPLPATEPMLGGANG